MGLYSLRRADPSVKLATVLFLFVLGYAYVFAFLMVSHWAGLTPADVAATYAPKPMVMESQLAPQSESQTQPLNLSTMKEEKHTVDTQLLIQDSHIHILIYDIVAALQVLIILGLEWRPAWRNIVITAAFAAGALDFSGQWLIKAGVPGFAFLTIGAGWLMVAVYAAVSFGTLNAVWPRRGATGSLA